VPREFSGHENKPIVGSRSARRLEVVPVSRRGIAYGLTNWSDGAGGVRAGATAVVSGDDRVGRQTK